MDRVSRRDQDACMSVSVGEGQEDRSGMLGREEWIVRVVGS